MHVPLLALYLILSGPAQPITARQDSRPLVRVPLLAAGPEAADPFASPLWETAAWLGPFVRSDRRAMPEAETTARLARTSDGLVLLVHCAEPRMDRLVATQRQRDDAVWSDDCIEVFVHRPGTPYLHLVVNALGARYDEREKDPAWDAEWQASVRTGEHSWEVALSLPWEMLGGEPTEGEEWGFNLCRSRQAEPELSQWSPTVEGFHSPEGFGAIRFGAGPWPLRVAWELPSRSAGRVHIDWSADETPAAPTLRVNGAETDGAFTLRGEGRVPLVCEASVDGALVLRAVYVADVTPLQGALDTARALLETVPADAGPRRESLGHELDRLARLAAEAPSSLAPDLMARIRNAGLRASHLAVWAATPKGEVAYGVETSLRKLLRHEPFRGQARGTLQLDAARREMDARQLVVFADAGPLLQVAAEVGPAVSESGAALAPEAFRIRRVGYVPTVQPSYVVDHVGAWPDPLLAATPFDVREGSFEPLWIDVRVPPEAAPGLYRGEIRLTTPSAAPTTVPLEVRVRGFTIPEAPSLQTAFGLDPGSWRVAQEPDAYIRNALEHRITPYAVGNPKLVSAPALDWQGAQRLEVEVRTASPGELRLLVVPVEGAPLVLGPEPVRPPEARLAFDLSAVPARVHSWRLELQAPGASTPATLTARLVGAERTVALVAERESRNELGADGWLTSWAHWEGTGWDDPARPAVWDWSEFDARMDTYLPLGLTAHVAGLQAPIGGWAREWESHLRARGWLDLGYTYLFDEPTPDKYPLLNAVMGEAKRAAPGLRNMMTAREFPPELQYVDIWCPEAYSFNPEAARAEQAKGKAVWWYVAFSTRHPYPNVWVDYPALDCRVWPWMTWKHDLDGMLYWSAVYWARNDPWRCAETFPTANGDGSLLYPGEDGRPVDSLRWECLRDGMEDYEVLVLLEAGASELDAAGGHDDLAARARALAAIPDEVVRSYKDYNPDPAALLAARAEMSDTLEQVVAALGHEPVVRGRPRHRPGVDLARLAAESIGDAGPHEVPAWTMPEARPEPGLVLRYSFDDDAPLAADLSGRGMAGTVQGAKRAPGAVGQGLDLDAGANVTLPGCSGILGAQPREGALALWVCPGFEPAELSSDLWQGYRVIAYLQKSSGNGLPDGYNEIGLFVHGPQLLARCGGAEDALWAAAPSPLRKGEWSHLCVTWAPERRALYVDGRPLVVREGAYTPVTLDGFAGRLAWIIHEQWSWSVGGAGRSSLGHRPAP